MRTCKCPTNSRKFRTGAHKLRQSRGLWPGAGSETTRVGAGPEALCDVLSLPRPLHCLCSVPDALPYFPSLRFPPPPHRVSAHTLLFAYPSSVPLPTNPCLRLLPQTQQGPFVVLLLIYALFFPV